MRQLLSSFLFLKQRANKRHVFPEVPIGSARIASALIQRETRGFLTVSPVFTEAKEYSSRAGRGPDTDDHAAFLPGVDG
jgi:hypothetical protein